MRFECLTSVLRVYRQQSVEDAAFVQYLHKQQEKRWIRRSYFILEHAEYAFSSGEGSSLTKKVKFGLGLLGVGWNPVWDFE